MNSLISDVPFDQFSRQSQVAKLLEAVRKKGETFRVLDAGGYKGRTAEFLKNDQVFVVDQSDVIEDNYIKGNALELPFKEGEFDFVVSFDVLEHIPETSRHRFFDECNRVSNRGVIISAPHASETNLLAEKKLNNLYTSLHGKDHRWLYEHIENGLPDFPDMEKYAKNKGCYTTVYPSNETTLWTLMQGLIFINSKYDLAAEDVIKINAFYNKHFRHDIISNFADAYRITLCCWKLKTDMTTIQQLPKLFDDPVLLTTKIELIIKLQQFHALLATKLATLSSNYQELYDQELKRSTILQKNSEQQLIAIDQLNTALAKKNLAMRYAKFVMRNLLKLNRLKKQDKSQ